VVDDNPIAQVFDAIPVSNLETAIELMEKFKISTEDLAKVEYLADISSKFSLLHVSLLEISTAMEKIGSSSSNLSENLTGSIGELLSINKENLVSTTDMISMFESLNLSIAGTSTLMEKLKLINNDLAVDSINVVTGFDRLIVSVSDLLKLIEKLQMINNDFVNDSIKISSMDNLFGFMDNFRDLKPASFGDIFASDLTGNIESMMDSIRLEFGDAFNPIEKPEESFKNPEPYLGLIPSLINDTIKRADSADTVQTVTPTITTAELNARTIKYYDDSLLRMNMMIEALEKSNYIMEKARDEANYNADKMANAIYKIGPTV
jgi:hypothetical protein